MYGKDNSRTTLYSIKMADNVEASLHVRRFVYKGERFSAFGFSIHTVPFRGESEVNTTTTKYTARATLLRWRKMGLSIERWECPEHKKGQ